MAKKLQRLFFDLFQDDLKDGLKLFHTTKGEYEFVNQSVYNRKRMYLQQYCDFKNLKNRRSHFQHIWRSSRND